MGVVFTPHQSNFSLQLTETTTENTRQSKCAVVVAIPNGSIYKILLQQRLLEHCKITTKVIRATESESMVYNYVF